MERIRRFLALPAGWVALLIGELVAIVAINAALSRAVGGFAWPLGVLLLIPEAVLLMIVNVGLRRRFLS